jgi:Rps23 Pro-64 3,4-dihydroxylase Tpa1-like proline 4-hydroxylase
MEYIYTTKSLTTDICNKIIELYDNDTTLKYDGVTFRGLDKRVKDATDIVIPEKTDVKSEWDEINDILSSELENNLKKYINKLDDKPHYFEINNYGSKYNQLSHKLYLKNNFMIQRYEKNAGKYIYHDDGAIDIPSKTHRVITYLWYLNDVEEGGETEFFGGDFKVKPEAGKLIFFPAFWCFPHRGNKPKSSHKYIITGWLYQTISSGHDTLHIPYIAETNIKVLNYEPENSDKIENSVDNSKLICDISNETTTIKPSENTNLLVFNYFRCLYPYIFKDYKNYTLNNESFMEDTAINDVYSKNICFWVFKQLNNATEIWEIDNITNTKYLPVNVFSNILPFIISSFEIITDIIKFKYNLSSKLNFNIKEWYFIKYTDKNKAIPSFFENKSYDMAIQVVISEYKIIDIIDDNSGSIYFGKNVTYQNNSEYILVFLIDFSFIYFNKNDEKINISLKDLTSNMLDNIDI